MSRFIPGVVFQGDLAKHPAVQAWQSFDAANSRPASVIILKERKKNKLPGKSAVYRLYKLRDDGLSVVAKRCEKPIAQVERRVYEEILPRLPIKTPRYYGSVDDTIDGYCWLFLEDAEGEPFCRSQQSHSEAAAKWLAVMHTTASKVEAIHSLPARDTDHYFEHLVGANERITESLRHSFLGIDDRRVLAHLLSQLDQLASKWEYVKASCEGLPRTLAHGDLAPKNLRVRRSATAVTILPFDWEMAGLGTVAADIFRLPTRDLATYQSILAVDWSETKNIQIDRFAAAGEAFRLAASINWSARSLVLGRSHCSITHPMSQLRIYAESLDRFFATWLRSN